jgi:transcriptional regulator with XRE-family HTH domain
VPAPPPDPAVMARALHLRRTQPELTLRQIAEAIGVRSASTVSNYIVQAEQAETWFPAANRREMSRVLHLTYGEVLDRLMRRMDEDDAEPEKVTMAIVSVGRELAKLNSLYPPNRHEIITEPAVPDPESTAAIQQALAELEAADREDRRQGNGS